MPDPHLEHQNVKIRQLIDDYRMGRVVIPAVGSSAKGVVMKPLSDALLCFETCVVMRSDDDSRLANEFARSFLRRYEPQRLPPKQMELSLSA